jgi:hypothetical protein
MSFPVFGQDNETIITGQWNGTLSVQGFQLKLVFHISKTEKGYKSTMDSPDQGATGIPVGETKFENSTLKLSMANMGAEYEGKLDENGVISGTFKQAGMSFPLNLTKEGAQIAQSTAKTVKIRGQVVDSVSQKAISYATVKFFDDKTKDTPLKVGASNEDGHFNLELKSSGQHFLTVEYLGKQPLSKSFSIEDKDIDLGKIAMSDAPEELDAVKVTAQKPLVKMDLDKITYNLTEDPDAKTNNVLEMLKKVPLVNVDGEENVQLKGSSNFKFYINGKPSSMLAHNQKDVLRSMPANTVKNIEVITDPGAKYDAEGVAGIINIVMQSQSSLGGYTVSLNAMASSLGQLNGGTHFSIKYGKIGLTGNLNYFRLMNQDMTTTVSRENFASSENRFLTQDGSTNYRGNMLMGYGELSYEIDAMNLVNVNVNNRGGDYDGKQFTDVLMERSNREAMFHYEQSTDLDIAQSGTTLGADYQRSFKVKERLLTASYKLDRYNSDQNFLTKIDPLLNFNSNSNRQFSFDDSYEHTFQLDYTTPIAEIHVLEAGAKFIKRINKSTSGLSVNLTGDNWLELASDNDKFSHLQDIWAAYAGYGLKYKKWGLKTGIRYEGTGLEVDYPRNGARNFKADYSNFVPSITATFMPKSGQTFRAGYNLRIQRPGITYLNPYVNTTDTSNIRYGNPELEVVKYHNFSLNYIGYKAKLTVNANLSYSFTNEGISDFTWLENYTSKTSYFNLLNENRWNLSTYLNWTPAMKLRIFGNLSGTYGKLQSNKDKTLKNEGFYGSLMSSIQYTLPRDYVLNLTGFVSTPPISLQGTGISYHYYNLSLSKKFLKNRLNIRLGTTNFLAKNLKIKQTLKSSDFYQSTLITQPLRQVNIVVSYRFGEMKSQIKKAKRTIKNEDQIQSENSNKIGSGVKL